MPDCSTHCRRHSRSRKDGASSTTWRALMSPSAKDGSGVFAKGGKHRSLNFQLIGLTDKSTPQRNESTSAAGIAAFLVEHYGKPLLREALSTLIALPLLPRTAGTPGIQTASPSSHAYPLTLLLSPVDAISPIGRSQAAWRTCTEFAVRLCVLRIVIPPASSGRAHDRLAAAVSALARLVRHAKLADSRQALLPPGWRLVGQHALNKPICQSLLETRSER